MSEYGATRWWEYYAVRYLMPSVAGIAIVKWICSHANDGLLPLLSLPSSGLDTASLVLLFLYGNLFCYVASYPVLVFHTTRVLDFADDRWTARISSDGYITTVAVTILAFLLTLIRQECRFWAAFILVSIFSLVQLWRLQAVLSTRIHVEGCYGVDGNPRDVNYAYGYTYALARRRVKASRESFWRKDYMETYRHLREHGNSAFIFLSELGLAALAYCVVTGSARSAQGQLSSLGILFSIWALPAVFVHLFGQYLERRFSWFDRRLRGPSS